MTLQLTAAECVRLVRGQDVRWCGTLEEAFDLLGMNEIVNGGPILEHQAEQTSLTEGMSKVPAVVRLISTVQTRG